MDEAIKYISKVEIKGLWGRYDLEWNLHPDVNVLSGANGTGKSTILRYIYEVIRAEYDLNSDLMPKIKELKVTFNNDETFINKFEIKTQQQIVDPFLVPPSSTQDVVIKQLSNGTFGVGIRIVSIDETFTSLLLNFTKPIDNQIITILDKHQKTQSKDFVKTVLDLDIFEQQRHYLNYQVNLGKRALSLNGNNSEEKRQEISYPRKRFIEILNEIFLHTDKHVDDTENEISFCLGDREITPYQLSSGEKQILIILLNALIQDRKPTIFFMDEPEISIHFDVQKKLIDYILELNPNVQIILATHSPAIIMDGWMNNVSEISDLIVTDNQAVLENAE